MTLLYSKIQMAAIQGGLLLSMLFQPVCEGGESGGGVELCPLRLHLGRLPPLRLGELGGNHDQAQVDHEEGADLHGQLGL